MKTHLSDITKHLQIELVPAFRRTRIPLLFLVLLLFSAAPVFAQDMDEDEDPEMEEIETEDEFEEDSEEDSEDAVSDEQTEQEEVANPAAEERTHCVLVLLPFTASYAEHVYVTNAISNSFCMK